MFVFIRFGLPETDSMSIHGHVDSFLVILVARH